MTPERAAYHLLMLQVGLREAFDQEFDEALENEDPLSKLILDLTSHASDINGCISVLQNFCCDHPPDIDAVYDLVWQDLCTRFLSGSLTDAELANLAWTLAEDAEDWWAADWRDFRSLWYYYDEFYDGIILGERYLQCRELFLTQRACSPEPISAPPLPEQTLLQRIREFFNR